MTAISTAAIWEQRHKQATLDGFDLLDVSSLAVVAIHFVAPLQGTD